MFRISGCSSTAARRSTSPGDPLPGPYPDRRVQAGRTFLGNPLGLTHETATHEDRRRLVRRRDPVGVSLADPALPLKQNRYAPRRAPNRISVFNGSRNIELNRRPPPRTVRSAGSGTCPANLSFQPGPAALTSRNDQVERFEKDKFPLYSPFLDIYLTLCYRSPQNHELPAKT